MGNAATMAMRTLASGPHSAIAAVGTAGGMFWFSENTAFVYGAELFCAQRFYERLLREGLSIGFRKLQSDTEKQFRACPPLIPQREITAKLKQGSTTPKLK
jgi:hypothetical protein